MDFKNITYPSRNQMIVMFGTVAIVMILASFMGYI